MITLAQASTVVDVTLASGTQRGFKPLTAAVLDAAGQIVAIKRADGSPGLLRVDVAIAKAWTVLAMGWSAREVGRRAERVPQFLTALGTLAGGRLIPVPGGIPIRDASGTLVGSVGVSGDASDNDEMCGVAGIEAAGLVPWLDDDPA